MENESPEVLIRGKKQGILTTGFVQHLLVCKAGLLLCNSPNCVTFLAQTKENRVVYALVADQKQFLELPCQWVDCVAAEHFGGKGKSRPYPFDR